MIETMLVSATGAILVGVALDTPLGIAGTAWWIAGLTLLPAFLWGLWMLIAGKSTPVFVYKGANTP